VFLPVRSSPADRVPVADCGGALASASAKPPRASSASSGAVKPRPASVAASTPLAALCRHDKPWSCGRTLRAGRPCSRPRLPIAPPSAAGIEPEQRGRGHRRRRSCHRFPVDVPTVVVVLGEIATPAQLDLATQTNARIAARNRSATSTLPAPERCGDRGGRMDHRPRGACRRSHRRARRNRWQARQVRVGAGAATGDRAPPARHPYRAPTPQNRIHAGMPARTDRDGQHVEERTLRFVQDAIGRSAGVNATIGPPRVARWTGRLRDGRRTGTLMRGASRKKGTSSP